MRNPLNLDIHIWRVQAFRDGSSLAGLKSQRSFEMSRVPAVSEHYLGAPFADDVAATYEALDSELTRKFANVEHAVMHFFVGVLKRDPKFTATIEETMALMGLLGDYGAIMQAAGIGEDEFTETFIDGVQMAANRTLTDTESNRTKGAAIALGLNGEKAFQAAVTFLSVIRLRLLLNFGQ